MQRVAFKMTLKAGCLEEYRKRHDQIWPELASALKKAGVRDYSIFFDESTLTLFAVQRLEPGHCAEQLPAQEIVRQWWDWMAPLMEVHPDNSPVTAPLQEVFHQD